MDLGEVKGDRRILLFIQRRERICNLHRLQTDAGDSFEEINDAAREHLLEVREKAAAVFHGMQDAVILIENVGLAHGLAEFL